VQVQAQEGYAAAGGGVGVVVLQTALTDALITEGLARDVISRIQGMRKEANLEYTARVRVAVTGDAALADAVRTHGAVIAAETLAASLDVVSTLPEGGSRVQADLDGHPLGLHMVVAD
jgi:isoleucyl-tRNA synthetase